MYRSFSLHKIKDENNLGFSPYDYSLFKYGDFSVAEKFGKPLAEAIIAQFEEEILIEEEVLISSSPYGSVHTASGYLMEEVKKNINVYLYSKNKKALKEIKVYRNNTYSNDYGEMDYEQRLSLISQDTYYIEKGIVNQKFCFFLDDIKITGSHEDTMKRILDHEEAEGNYVFVYFAELINKEIPANFENYLNNYAVQKPSDLVKIINNHFVFNTRVIKYILKLERTDFIETIKHFTDFQKNELAHLAISNNYHLINEFKSNLQYITELLWQSTYKKDKEKV